MSTLPPALSTVAIVGSGFTGTMVAANLLRLAKTPTRILLIERCGRFAAGVAYSSLFPEHVLNVPAGRMSALPEDPDHFLRWAHTRDNAVVGGSFVTRRTYGQYLADLLDSAEAAAPPEMSVHRLAGEARAIERQAADSWKISLADGRSFTANIAVLSIGNYDPADPPVSDTSFYQSASYARDPWASGALDVRPDASVLLLGTGLTMLDIAVALRARAHRGPIHALSRRGLLPQSHRESASAPVHHPRPANIEQWPRTASGLLRELRREVRMALVNDVDWREVVTSIRHDTPALWQALPREERQRFLRHLRSFWETHRHRASPATAARIEELRATGQLHVHAARVLNYEVQNNVVQVHIRRRGAEQRESIAVERVINCTGPDTNLARVPDLLVQNLRDNRLIRPDELGLGLDTNDAGALIDADGVASSSLFLVGPLRKGRLWENTAVPELRVEAQKMAAQLANAGARAAARNTVLS